MSPIEFSLIRSITPSKATAPFAETKLDLYKHEASGLRVLISSDSHSTPLFNLSIIVPTLAHDHSGLPHTLEHLIFLGSKAYPEKGFLDKLATMGAANGTNAYTSEDHTCYTLSTASPEGLYTITPVFLDHVLRPLLRDEEFAAEVWDGCDKGVVYSEMRGREWTEGDQQAGLVGQLLAEHSTLFEAYKWDCGGRTPVIRELSMGRIKEYHAYWYNTSNVIVQLSGPISQELCTRLLHSISALLNTFSKAGRVPVLPKPLSTDQMLHSIQTKRDRFIEALFPAEDESQCSVALAWDLTGYSEKDLIALGILSKYLKDTSGSPLNHHFTQDPDNIICSTVDIEIKWWLSAAIFVSFSGISTSDKSPWNRPHSIAKELKRVLKELVSGIEGSQESRDAFKRDVSVALKNHTLNTKERAEEDPHDLAFSYLLPELLKASHLKTEFTGKSWIEGAVILRELDQADVQYWIELLGRFGGMEWVGEVLLKPSRLLSDQLKSLKSEIKEAREQRQPSTNESINVPTIKVTSQLISDAIKHRDIAIQSCTKCVQVVTVKSSLNYVTLGINIESIIVEHPELLPYLVLFQELFAELDVNAKRVPGFEASILKEGHTYSYKELQSLLHQSFSSVSSSVGFEAGSSSPFVIGFQETCLVATATCTADISPGEAINLLLSILLDSIYSEDRIEVILEQLNESLIDGQRDPGVISDAILMQLLCGMEGKSNGNNKRAKCQDKLTIFEACGLFKQHQFLKDLNASDAIDKLRRIQELLKGIITESDGEWNMFLQIGSSPDRVPKLKGFQGAAFPSKGVRRLAFHFVTETTAVILPIRDLTASHLHLTVACPELLDDPRDEACLVEFLSCSVLCHLMSMLEGPLYRAIRGAGLAYHADVSLSLWSGLLSFNVYQASDVVACYHALCTLLSDSTSWLTPQNIDLAKKALIFQLVNERSTTSDILASLLRDTLRGFSIEKGGGEYFRLLEGVGMESILAVADKFLLRLIDASVARVAIVQHGNGDEGAVRGMIEGFARAGFEGFEGRCLQRDYLKSNKKG